MKSDEKIIALLREKITHDYSKEAWEKALNGTVSANLKNCGQKLWHLWDNIEMLGSDPYDWLEYYFMLKEAFEKSTFNAFVSPMWS